jgi:hypothetical protein
MELRQRDQPVAFWKGQGPKQAAVRHGGGRDAGAGPDGQHDRRDNGRHATGENAAPGGKQIRVQAVQHAAFDTEFVDPGQPGLFREVLNPSERITVQQAGPVDGQQR